MKKRTKGVKTVALGEVRELLRDSAGMARILNLSGWSVFQSADGIQSYIFDEESGYPVTFRQLAVVSHLQRRRTQQRKPSP